MDIDAEGKATLNMENDLMMADVFGEAMSLQPSVVNARAMQMFTGGDGAPRRSDEGPIATDPTLWLIKLAKEAVSELFAHHRNEVQRSWGSMLDQEEAVGYLVCDAVGMDILPEEARTIGKAAVKAVFEPKRGAKDADDKIKGAAAARRARARQAAEKNPERATGLEARLAEIDAERDAKRAALWAGTPNLGMPDRKSQIVEQKPKAQPKPPDPVQQAEQALAAAEVAQVAADGAAREARRARARVQAPSFNGKKEEKDFWDGIVYKTDEKTGRKYPDLVEPAELERRDALRRAISEAEATLRRAEFDAKAAAREVEGCRCDVEMQTEMRAAEQKYARERAARQAEAAKACADAEDAAEEARAEAEACEARTEEMLARHKEMCAEFDRERRNLQYELVRAQWAEDRTSCVQQHAAEVWGPAWQMEDRPAPKVFSLVGKSAEEVRGMSSQVSQVGTGTEERVALNRVGWEPLAAE